MLYQELLKEILLTAESMSKKNGRGRWAIAKIYVRIGIGQSVISNVNQGGGISDIREFLKTNYGEKWKEIYSNLKRLGKIIPEKKWKS